MPECPEARTGMLVRWQAGDGRSEVSAAHTPGPWRMLRGVLGTERYFIAMMMPSSGYGFPETFPPEEHAEGNARLIGAAPELLEALELVAHFLPQDEEWDSGTLGRLAEALPKVLAAIAKARGTAL